MIKRQRTGTEAYSRENITVPTGMIRGSESRPQETAFGTFMMTAFLTICSPACEKIRCKKSEKSETFGIIKGIRSVRWQDNSCLPPHLVLLINTLQ